jgi:phosphoribosylaminoimidazolecarboxamide formyltransferase/IMP cyclohydrolase
VGVGPGQPNRLDSADLAVRRAGTAATGSVAASDAFFPFPDALEVLARAGATAVAHPGGSIRDGESIALANRYSMAMVMTGMRHFRH